MEALDPDFFFGFELNGPEGIKMASPEKALLDFLYLSPARSGLFASLPEVEFPSEFDTKTARKMIAEIRSELRRKIVLRRFDGLLRRFQ